MQPGFKVAVLGANGHTGAFVLEELGRLGVTAIAATRSGWRACAGDERAPCRTLDFCDPANLDRALGGADAVINCAGPFFDTAAPAAEAAVRAGIAYLDVTAEQVTAVRLFESLDARAKRARVTLLPAMAFFGALADLMVCALTEDHASVDAIDIAVGLDCWRPTRGTRLTGARNTFERSIVRGGRLVGAPTPAPSRDWDFPDPFGVLEVTCAPMAETILIARHVRAHSVTSFMNLKPLEDLGDLRTPPPAPCDAWGRSAQRFVMDVEIAAGDQRRRATAMGRDIYAVSASLVAHACAALLSGEALRGRDDAGTGVRAAGEVFNARAFLARLALAMDIRFS